MALRRVNEANYGWFSPRMDHFRPEIRHYRPVELAKYERAFRREEQQDRLFRDHPLPTLRVWSTQQDPTPFDSEVYKDAETMTYDELRKKYGPDIYLPFSPFVKRRLVARTQLIFTWLCDRDKNKSHQEILDRLYHVPVKNKRGHQIWSKQPVLHSDGRHMIMPSWYYGYSKS